PAGPHPSPHQPDELLFQGGHRNIWPPKGSGPRGGIDEDEYRGQGHERGEHEEPGEGEEEKGSHVFKEGCSMKKDVQESLVAWRKLIEWSRVDDHENKREEGSQ